jgi:hypothetical protein
MYGYVIFIYWLHGLWQYGKGLYECLIHLGLKKYGIVLLEGGTFLGLDGILYDGMTACFSSLLSFLKDIFFPLGGYGWMV